MGIRFACHVCGKRLNIKRELAGRRGVCPSCSAKFRIPLDDAETSAPVDSRAAVTSASKWKVSDQQPSGSVAVAPAKRPDKVAVASMPSIQGDMQPSGEDEIPSSVLDEDSDATWYVRPPGGGQYGPASGELLKQWIQEGRVAASALLWRDGWPQWRDAAEVLQELSGRLPGLDQSAMDSPMIGSPDRGDAADLRGGDFAGSAGVGLQRRGRGGRRITLVGILLALALMLIGVLVVVVNR